MTTKKMLYAKNLPTLFQRDEFLTPFDRVFDKIMENQFPNFTNEFGVRAFENNAYPKCNIYDYSDKVGIIAEIPGLTKEQVKIEIEENVLIISGDKHKTIEDEGAKILKRELKQSSFKRSFELGDVLDSDKISANFEDGILSIDLPKRQPKEPAKKIVEIS
tara:strand:+ start:189 stop:671 length:483 start_codon:yes stop_codon:yes gene_type:complete